MTDAANTDHQALDHGFWLADWKVEPRLGTISRNDSVVRLEPKVMGVLVCLAANQGEPVSRQKLLDEVWPGVVVQEEVLNRCVSLLRTALQDDSRQPHFVQTVPKVGYLLIPNVTRVVPAATARPREWARTAVTAAAVFAAAGGLFLLVLLDADDWIPESRLVTIAVLPFTDRGPDADRDFSAGLTDQVISDLATVDGLRVKLRNPGGEEDICKVGKVIDTDTLLWGGVRRDRERLRVTVQWINAEDCFQILAETYENRVDSVFQVQNAISGDIVRRLARALRQERVRPAPQPEPAAYEPFLLGRHHLVLGRYDLMRRGEASIRRSIAYFEEAIEQNPDLSDAYMGLAEAYIVLPSYVGMIRADETEQYLHEASLALERVAAIEGNPARTYAARAFIHTLKMEWAEAEGMFQAALNLNPDDANLHYWYSQFLARVGYVDRSLQHARTANELNSVSALLKLRLATSLLWAGMENAAAAQFDVARDDGVPPTINPESDLILMYRQRDFDAMRARIQLVEQAGGRSGTWVDVVMDGLIHPGDFERAGSAQRVLSEAISAGEIDPRLYWGALVLLQQADLALGTLTGMLARQRPQVGYLVEFLYAKEAGGVRRSPQFASFVQRVGLDGFWDLHGWPASCRRQPEAISCD